MPSAPTHVEAPIDPHFFAHVLFFTISLIYLLYDLRKTVKVKYLKEPNLSIFSAVFTVVFIIVVTPLYGNYLLGPSFLPFEPGTFFEVVQTDWKNAWPAEAPVHTTFFRRCHDICHLLLYLLDSLQYVDGNEDFYNWTNCIVSLILACKKRGLLPSDIPWLITSAFFLCTLLFWLRSVQAYANDTTVSDWENAQLASDASYRRYMQQLEELRRARIRKQLQTRFNNAYQVAATSDGRIQVETTPSEDMDANDDTINGEEGSLKCARVYIEGFLFGNAYRLSKSRKAANGSDKRGAVTPSDEAGLRHGAAGAEASRPSNGNDNVDSEPNEPSPKDPEAGLLDRAKVFVEGLIRGAALGVQKSRKTANNDAHRGIHDPSDGAGPPHGAAGAEAEEAINGNNDVGGHCDEPYHKDGKAGSDQNTPQDEDASPHHHNTHTNTENSNPPTSGEATTGNTEPADPDGSSEKKKKGRRKLRGGSSRRERRAEAARRKELGLPPLVEGGSGAEEDCDAKDTQTTSKPKAKEPVVSW